MRISVRAIQLRPILSICYTLRKWCFDVQVSISAMEYLGVLLTGEAASTWFWCKR